MYYDQYHKEYNANDLAIASFEHTKGLGKIKVTEFVDMTTGEIISAEVARTKYSVGVIYPEARAKREVKLNSLRKEVRDFALFILKFRNNSGGFKVPFERLLEWYAKYTDKKISHIKRYIEPLTNAGIIDESEGIVFPHNDFSIQTKNPIRNSHKADPFSAGVIFSNLLARKT